MGSNKGGFLDSLMESTCMDAEKRNPLIMIQVLACRPRAGFQVDSPVKRPDASKLARCAPPYTDGAGEEPCRGVVSGKSNKLKLRLKSRRTDGVVDRLSYPRLACAWEGIKVQAIV